MDVSALHINITHEEAKMEATLDDKAVIYPETYFLMQLIYITLDKNYFSFKDDFYKQVKGVATAPCP